MSANYGPVVSPPGGIYVYDKDGEHAEAHTRDGLIAALTELRRANGKRIKDPARDVDQYLASKLGGYHSPFTAEDIADRPEKPKTLTERVGAWLATRYAKLGAIKYVSQMEATRRAQICLKCPKNVEWRTSCRSCSDQVPRIEQNIVVVSQNRRTLQHERLFACSVAGHENRVAIFLPKTHLMHVRNIDKSKHGTLPSFCWLKKLHEE